MNLNLKIGRSKFIHAWYWGHSNGYRKALCARDNRKADGTLSPTQEVAAPVDCAKCVKAGA